MEIKRKPKLLLLNPARMERRGFLMNDFSKIPPLNLAIVAALTPGHWEVKISDENYIHHLFEPADLVGLTGYTSNAPRAYEIATAYREKGIKTVMGGIHASMLPEEALQYVDSVVVGEAENVWGEVVSDFERGQLKKIYRGEMGKTIHQPMPRHDLIHPDYIFGSIQTTRGCPFDCDFCTVSAFNGKQFRYRPLPDVLEELKAINKKFLLFVDDNLVGYSKHSYERSIELFTKMREMNIRMDWMAQVSMNVADDERVLKAAAKSGCRNLFIGFESDDEHQLQAMDKKLNLKRGVKKYDEVIRKIHKHGISVLGAFIFGHDTDTPDSMQKRAKYIVNSGVDIMQFTVLTPMPGTRLFNRLSAEGNITACNYPRDWRLYDALRPVATTPEMKTEEMNHLMKQVFTLAYNRNTCRKKFLRTLLSTRNFTTAYWCYVSNYNYYRVVFEEEIMLRDPDYRFWKRNSAFS